MRPLPHRPVNTPLRLQPASEGRAMDRDAARQARADLEAEGQARNHAEREAKYLIVYGAVLLLLSLAFQFSGGLLAQPGWREMMLLAFLLIFLAVRFWISRHGPDLW